MTFDEYMKQAMRTSGGDKESQKLYGPMGLAGESGEVIDYLKKVYFHGHQLDLNKLSKELGDVLWYLAAIANAFDLSLDNIAEENIRKLEERYPNGFEKEKSINRKE